MKTLAGPLDKIYDQLGQFQNKLLQLEMKVDNYDEIEALRKKCQKLEKENEFLKDLKKYHLDEIQDLWHIINTFRQKRLEEIADTNTDG